MRATPEGSTLFTVILHKGAICFMHAQEFVYVENWSAILESAVSDLINSQDQRNETEAS